MTEPYGDNETLIPRITRDALSDKPDLKKAVIKSAWTDDPPPVELVSAWLCEKFGKLPHELDDLDACTLQRAIDAYNAIELYNHYNRRAKQSAAAHGLVESIAWEITK